MFFSPSETWHRPLAHSTHPCQGPGSRQPIIHLFNNFNNFSYTRECGTNEQSSAAQRWRGWGREDTRGSRGGQVEGDDDCCDRWATGCFWVVAFLCNCRLVVAPDNLNDDDVTQPLPLTLPLTLLLLALPLLLPLLCKSRKKQAAAAWREAHPTRAGEKSQRTQTYTHTLIPVRRTEAALLTSTPTPKQTATPKSTSTIVAAADIVKSLRWATFEFSWVCITFTFACGRRTDLPISQFSDFPVDFPTRNYDSSRHARNCRQHTTHKNPFAVGKTTQGFPFAKWSAMKMKICIY